MGVLFPDSHRHIQPVRHDGGMTDLRERLAAARVYLCTDGRRREGDLAAFLDAVLAGGVDIIQLREKGLEAREELALLEVFADACRRHGRLLAVNDRADVALAAGADVLHLGQDDLPVPVARQILGPGPLIGRSSHGPAQASSAAAEEGVDYFCAGPVWTTPTKPRSTGRGSPSAGSALTGSMTCSPRGRRGWWWSVPLPRPPTRVRRPPHSRPASAATGG
jgi:thiamine-phosphate pyrophosphorylase